MSAVSIGGLGGSVTLPTGFIFKISAWSATQNMDTVDDTGFPDVGNWHTHITTGLSLGGAAMGTGQSGVSGPVPTSGMGSNATLQASYQGSFTLQAFTGCSYSFTGNVTMMTYGRVYNGKFDVMCSFVSSGPVTISWA